MTIEERKTPSGEYNVAPAGFRQLSEKEFASSLFFTYTPVAHEYRQVFRDEHGNKFPHYISIHMYHFHDGTGIAMARDWNGDKVEYYKFGCEHTYQEISRPAGNRSGLHTDKCSKCGYVWTYDTSD